MRIMLLFGLIVFSQWLMADAVYKCEFKDKTFVYQSLPCSTEINQKVLDIKKQTPEEIERSKQLLQQTKEERRLLDAQEKQRLESERIKAQAIIEKQQANAIIQRRQLDTTSYNGTTVINYGTYGYPYYNGYSYSYYDVPYLNNGFNQVYPSSLQTSPYSFYSPHRTGVNFAPYPNTGRQFAPYPNINPNPVPVQPSHNTVRMRSAVPTR